MNDEQVAHIMLTDWETSRPADVLVLEKAACEVDGLLRVLRWVPYDVGTITCERCKTAFVEGLAQR